MSVNISFKGVKILITRPSQRGLPLAKLIIREGGEAIYFPVMEIRSINNKFGTNLGVIDADIIIFISINSVNFFLDNLDRRLPISAFIIAVGKGTSSILEDNGVYNILRPSQGSGSEVLLTLSELIQVKNKSITIVRGLGGRTLLADILAARGAKISYVEVYKRILPIYTMNMYREAIIADIIICTSMTGVTNLVRIFKNDIKIILTKPLVVLSVRIQSYAISLGFNEVLVSTNIDDISIMQKLSDIVGRLRRSIQ